MKSVLHIMGFETAGGKLDLDLGLGIFKTINLIAGWSSLVARRAHNPKVGGSNPPPAIFEDSELCLPYMFLSQCRVYITPDTRKMPKKDWLRIIMECAKRLRQVRTGN